VLSVEVDEEEKEYEDERRVPARKKNEATSADASQQATDAEPRRVERMNSPMFCSVEKPVGDEDVEDRIL